MDQSNLTSSSSTESPHCNGSCERLEAADVAFPRQTVLHPILRGIYDLPDDASGPHVRLHPAIANADLRSWYATDPEIVVPRPLFSSSGSRSSSNTVGANGHSATRTRRSSSIDTVIEHSSSNPSSSLVKLFMDEIDAELAVQTLAKYRADEVDDDTIPNGESQRASRKTPSPQPSSESLTVLSAASKDKAPWVQKQIHTLRFSGRRIAKISVSNLRVLAVAEAIARVISFKDSPEYGEYQIDQDLIFENPEQPNLAAKHSIARLKETASWARYAADLTFILEHGDMEDIEMIAEPEFRRSTASNSKAPSPASG